MKFFASIFNPRFFSNSFFEKRKVLQRVARAFWIYVAFILSLAIVGSVLSVDVGIFVIFFGVLGQLCIFSCIGPPPFFIPIASACLIFIVLDLRAEDSIILKHKIRAALIIIAVILFFLGGIFIVRPMIRREIADRKTERLLQDVEYYKREYLEIGEPTSSEQFIYARDNRIMVSTMDGKNPRIIKEIPLDEAKKIFSVSPKGTYYIATSINNRQSGAADTTGSSEVRTVADNTFVMSITNLELLQDELKLCKWSFDEQFLACQYVGRTSKRERLVLFKVAGGSTERVYDDPSWGDTWRNFTWSDENLDLFYDQDEKIYRIDNIKEMSESGFTVPPHRVLLDHLTPCLGAGAYQNNTIYCVTTVNQLVGYRKPPDNQLLTYNDGLIIAYPEPENNKPESPVVLAKAPFSFGAGYGLTLYPVDANYIAAYGISNVFFLLNLQTGKINRFQTYSIYGDDIIHGDDIGFYEHIKTENIFYNAYKGTTEPNIFNNAFEGTVPVPYRGVP